VPAWMFERAACDHLRLAVTPIVTCEALAELQVLVRTAQRDDVLQAQHRSLSAAGGADATVRPPHATLAPEPLSPAAVRPAVSDPPAGRPGQGDPAAGATAPAGGRPAARR